MGDQLDAMSYALGSLAPAMKRAGDSARRFGEAASKLPPVATSASVPPGEVHAVVNGRVAGKITGLATVEAENLAMRCANCGGRAILDGGEFGTAGASYRCGSCGVVLDDCKQCRAIHARRTDGSCPRCSGRERRKAKA